jgi:hypothetical protein
MTQFSILTIALQTYDCEPKVILVKSCLETMTQHKMRIVIIQESASHWDYLDKILR